MMGIQRFVVEIKTKERDGCGNYIRPQRREMCGEH